MQPNNSGIKPWQWTVTIIVIIALIVLGVFVATRNDDTETTNDQQPAQPQIAQESNRLVVTDQFPGNIVYITTVQLAQDGFVVIHKDNAGAPGAVIGSVYFPKGIGPTKVTLTEKTVDGGTYYAMLHSDSNADKQFSETTDATLKDTKGMVIMKSFKARLDLPEDKG
ncbi:MAG: hypothetical protein HZA80_02880 [Candidatus Taylorbacteria bacterium]|nr:hypothetical protein [Candidatus Taylorbacteria bacterium]